MRVFSAMLDRLEHLAPSSWAPLIGQQRAAAARRTSEVAIVARGDERKCHPAGRILTDCGAIAQLGERLLCKQEVTGSIPVGSIGE